MSIGKTVNMWLGYFEEFPDYLTQGESLGELEENLRDLYGDLPGGEIPGIRRAAELYAGLTPTGVGLYQAAYASALKNASDRSMHKGPRQTEVIAIARLPRSV